MYALIVGGVCALVVGLILVLGPVLAAVLTVVGIAVTALALRPAWSAYATIILGLTAFPAFIPYSVQLGPTTLYLFEPALALAAAWAIATHKAPAFANHRALWLGVLLFCATLAGVAQGHPPIEIIGDGRGLLTVLLAIVLASRLYRAPEGAVALRVLLWSLWVSFAVTLAAAVLEIPIAGRSEVTALFLNSSGAGSSDSTRYLTAASEISVLVACASLALMITGKVPARPALAFLVPSLAIVFLGFSRNSFLALGMAALFAIIAARTMKPVAVALKVAIVAGPFVLILALANTSFGLPGGEFVTTQIDAFMSRVVGGLDTSTIKDDTSAIARSKENAYLLQGIANSPVTGHGFGFAYREPVGLPGSFSATKGPYYGHNFYLWITVKAGIIGLLIFLASFALPILKALRGGSDAIVGLGAAGAGLLLSIAFAPFPNDVNNGGSLAVGLLFGALLAASSVHAPDDRDRGNSQRIQELQKS